MLKIKLIVTALFLVLFTMACATDEYVESAENDSFEPIELRTQYEDIKVTKVVGGLERPWALAFLPDGRLLVTERPGRLNIVENGEATGVNGTPEVTARGQGGMMEVSVHPDYEENGWIYLTYSKGNSDGDTAVSVVRGRLDGTDYVDVEEVFIQNRYSSPGRHYGSKIAWDKDGIMFVSIGDRGANPPRAQDLSDQQEHFSECMMMAQFLPIIRL